MSTKEKIRAEFVRNNALPPRHRFLIYEGQTLTGQEALGETAKVSMFGLTDLFVLRTDYDQKE